MNLKLLTVILFVTLAACSTTKTKEEVEVVPSTKEVDVSQLYIHFPDDKEVVFMGKISVDTAENISGGMMYPGYNAGTFLISILAHAALQGGMEAGQEKKRQENADAVLNKYKPILEDISGQSLIEGNFELQLVSGDVTLMRHYNDGSDENKYIASVQPVYYLTQNERSLILTNKISFYESQRPSSTRRSVVTEYVSSPCLEENPGDYWASDGYRSFIYSSKFLFIETVRMALEFVHAEEKFEGEKKTIRYYESGKKKVERGIVIREDCDRLVFISLRGAIKSVPVFDSKSLCADETSTMVLNKVQSGLR